MTFSILGVTGYWYGLIVGVSALAYLALAGVLGFKRRLRAGAVRVFGLLGIPLGLLGARLVFCLVNYAYYVEAISLPDMMLCFWDGGYSMVGMMGGLVLAALLTSRIAKVRFGTLMDVVTAPMGLLLFGMRLAEGFTGTLGVGRQVDAEALAQSAPWLFVEDHMGTMTFYRLAVYRYEAVAALVLLAVMLCLFLSKRVRETARKGDLALLFFAMYGVAQIVLESMRDDGHLILTFIRVQQLGGALMAMLALAVFGARFAHIRQARWQNTLAWLLIPVAAIVLVMMVKPINHVLDLSGHMGLGIAILAALGVYMALFLRKRGTSLRLTLCWLVMLVAVAVVVMMEFSIDGSSSIVRDYAIMALAALAMLLAPATLWATLRRGVYREESISVHLG